MISFQDYVTASGRFLERLESEELTDDVKANAEELLSRVNAALEYVEHEDAEISSGFRPSAVNRTTANAATKSTHMSGEGLDVMDDANQTLCKKLTASVLEKFDLYREDSNFTKGKYTNWCHLQTRKTKSGKRIFKP